MKKLKSLFIAILLLFSCLSLTGLAENSSATISEDYQQLIVEGNSYSRFNAASLEVEYYMAMDTPITLSATQQETVKEIILQTNESQNMIHADIYYKDGAVLSVDFLRDDYQDIYNEMVSGQNTAYLIDFGWPEGNTVTAERPFLFGNSVTLRADELEWCDYYSVTIANSEAGLTLLKGSLIIIDDSYYYVDYEEAGITNGYEFYPYDYAELSAHEITDANLLSNIKDAEENFYEDDMGFLYDDDFTESLSTVFMVFVFAVIPFAIFVLFLILAIRSKTFYRKLFSTICVLAVAELAIFAIITSFVMMVR